MDTKSNSKTYSCFEHLRSSHISHINHTRTYDKPTQYSPRSDISSLNSYNTQLSYNCNSSANKGIQFSSNKILSSKIPNKIDSSDCESSRSKAFNTSQDCRPIVRLSNKKICKPNLTSIKNQVASPINKFDEKSQRLQSPRLIASLPITLSKTYNPDPSHAYNSNKRIQKLNPYIRRVSFGSRRQTFEFDIYIKEEQCLRNSDKFSKLLRSTSIDDDCDTDDQQIERGIKMCVNDLQEGIRITIEKIFKKRRCKSVGFEKKEQKRYLSKNLKMII